MTGETVDEVAVEDVAQPKVEISTDLEITDLKQRLEEREQLISKLESDLKAKDDIISEQQKKIAELEKKLGSQKTDSKPAPSHSAAAPVAKKVESTPNSPSTEENGIVKELPPMQNRKSVFENKEQPAATSSAKPAHVGSIREKSQFFQPQKPAENNSSSPSSPSSSVGSPSSNAASPSGSIKDRMKTFGSPSPSPSPSSSPITSPTTEGSNPKELNRRSTWSAAKFKAVTEKCTSCGKTVYEVEKISIDDKPFHKTCLRCTHCDCVLKLGNYASLQGKVFCKPHFKQLFKSKGNYSEGFGEEKPTAKWIGKGENVPIVL